VCVTGNDTVQCSIEEGQHTTASASSTSVSHHCTSSYYGNILDPVNNLNVSYAVRYIHAYMYKMYVLCASRVHMHSLIHSLLYYTLQIAFTGFLCTRGSFVGVVVTTGAETLLAKMIKRKEWPHMR
jgi:hypothetical protein